MRLAYTAVAALAALLSCSDSVPTAGDPEAVLEHDVSLVAHKTDGDDYGVDAKRLLRATGGEENGPYSKKVNDEARNGVDTAITKKLGPVTTVLATGMFGTTTKQARNAAAEAAAAAADKMGPVTKVLAGGVFGKTTKEAKEIARQEAAMQKAMVFVQKLMSRSQKGAKGADVELSKGWRALIKKYHLLVDRYATVKTGGEANRPYKELQKSLLKNTKEVDDVGGAVGAPPGIAPAA